ncbi:MAG: hypothetical protein QM784_29145 [Polyangiaceae bacterium]
MKSGAANPEWLLEALIRSCAVTVEGNGKGFDTDLRHETLLVREHTSALPGDA